MSDAQLLAVSGALIAAMFGLLVALLGWLGSRVYSKLDEMGATLLRISGDLHEKINRLDNRVTKVETYQQQCTYRGAQHR